LHFFLTLRYIFGTDKLRPNAFEVRGLNGASTGVVQCGDAAILSQWLKYVTDNIVGLTNLQVKLFNRTLASSERVEYMGWVNEGVLNNNQPWQCWRPKFLTLRSTDLVLSDTPPVRDKKSVYKIAATKLLLEQQYLICKLNLLHFRVRGRLFTVNVRGSLPNFKRIKLI